MTSSSSSRSPSRNKGESALRIVFGYLERKEKKKWRTWAGRLVRIQLTILIKPLVWYLAFMAALVILW
jgi:hypothetical protein